MNDLNGNQEIEQQPPRQQHPLRIGPIWAFLLGVVLGHNGFSFGFVVLLGLAVLVPKGWEWHKKTRMKEDASC